MPRLRAMELSQAALKETQKRQLKDRLLDEAQSKTAQHFHARQTLFPAEQYIHTWHDEIKQGEKHLEALIDEIYAGAGKDD